MALQPQTPAQPTQPTVATGVKQKRQAPRFALEYPCNPPTPPKGETVTWRSPPPLGGRPSHARGGDFNGGGEYQASKKQV